MQIIVAVIVALIAWASLALQFGLEVSRAVTTGRSVGMAIWRFFGFFTILTNLAVALVASAMVLRRTGWLNEPRVRLATATAIVLVGIVYALLLRRQSQPSGWYALADHGLHDVVPPLFVLAWVLSGHGTLAWRDTLWVAAAPLIYFAYVLARGAFDGWYPYWFLDPGNLSPAQMARNGLMLLAGFLTTGVLLVAADRWLGRPAQKRQGRAH